MDYASVSGLITAWAHTYHKTRALHMRRFFKNTTISYQELDELTKNMAHFLLHHVKQQESILIWAPNMPEWVVAFLGSLRAGIIVVPVGLHTTEELVEKYIHQTKPKLLLCSKYYPLNTHIHGIKQLFLEDVFETIKQGENKPLPYVSQSCLAEIVFTSGTTGEPKGVMITHENILFATEELVKIIPQKKPLLLLSVLPLSHIMEQIVGVMSPLSRGATIFYIPSINAITITKALRKYHITDFGVVPQMIRIFLDTITDAARERKQLDVLKVLLEIATILPWELRRKLFHSIHKELGGKLRLFGVGSAHLDSTLAKTWEAMGITILEGYGATETTSIITANRIGKRKLGSAGKKLSGIDIQLSASGEILVKGKNVTKGYFNDTQKTSEAFTDDGYYKTGDIGYFDKQGFLYITGRDKFKIVTASGDKIFPEDIEKKLNNHPAIWDSCVLGQKKTDGEIVCAVVILKKGIKEPIEKIIAKVNQTLESNQQILEYHIWKDKDFPRLHTLKVDRSQILSYYASSNKEEFIKETTENESTDVVITLLAKACDVPTSKITDTSNLSTDLQMDSLKRVTFVSLLEEEIGVELDEAKIDKATTVSAVRQLIGKPIMYKPPYNLEKTVKILRSSFYQNVKVILQNVLVLPIYSFFSRIELESEQSLKDLPSPVVFLGNHPSTHDQLALLKFLSYKQRKKLIILVSDIHWKQKKLKHTGPLLTLLGGAFPINKYGGPIRLTLEAVADFLEDGYSIVILPEGTFTPQGKELGKLHKGVELFTQGTNIPIVPYYISRKTQHAFNPYLKSPRRWGPVGIVHSQIHTGKLFTLTTDQIDPMSEIKKRIIELDPDREKDLNG